MIKKNEFRYDINALRAIAVMGVVFFHFKFPFCKGGFSGVDVFFVISGYLMSRIIFKELGSKSFSYKEFLVRRIKRIVPALLFVTSIVIAACFFLYFPADLKVQATNALYSLLFYSNFWYIQHSGYFELSSSSNIFLHTWSLAVEFQFYIFYPVFLVFLNNFVKKRSLILSLLIVSIILIFCFSLWRTKVNAVASFYLLPTRSWELIIGGLVFLIEGKLVEINRRKMLAITGYLVIGLSFGLLKSELAWPGIYTWLPVGATCMIIAAGVNDFRLIRSSVVQYLGKISYSLYLWHWPVIVLSQYIGIETSNLSCAVLILISIGLASFTNWFIENRDVRNNRLTASMAVVVACIILFTSMPVNRFIFKKESLDIAAYSPSVAEKRNQFSEGKCYIIPGGVRFLNKEACLKTQKGKKNFLLLGDSHAAELSESLHNMLLSKKINLMQSTASGCLPLMNSHGEGQCTFLMNYIYNDFIVNNHKSIDGIILTANWIKGYDDPEGLIRNLSNTINFLKKYNLKLILIGQTECYTIPYHIIVAREIQYNISLKQKYIIRDGASLNNLLKSRFPEYYVDIYNHQKVPGLYLNHTPYLFDTDHLSKYGADLVAKKIISDSITSSLFED